MNSGGVRPNSTHSRRWASGSISRRGVKVLDIVHYSLLSDWPRVGCGYIVLQSVDSRPARGLLAKWRHGFAQHRGSLGNRAFLSTPDRLTHSHSGVGRVLSSIAPASNRICGRFVSAKSNSWTKRRRSPRFENGTNQLGVDKTLSF